jgi:hypothetical protein
MSPHVHGRCGNCAGLVVTPAVWHGVTPPVPSCQTCGAVAAQPELPVIRMEPRRAAPVALPSWFVAPEQWWPLPYVIS